MKAKRLMAFATSAMMVLSSAFPGYSATLPTDRTSYAGSDAWQEITLPLPRTWDYMRIKDVEFNTNGGAKANYTLNSHSMTLKNLYHAAADGEEQVTVNFKDGTSDTLVIKYTATDGATPAGSGRATGATKINGANSDLAIPLGTTSSGSGITGKYSGVSSVYIEDMPVADSNFTYNVGSGELRVTKKAFATITPGTYDVYAYTNQGDAYKYEVDFEVTAGAERHAAVSPEYAWAEVGSGKDVVFGYDMGEDFGGKEGMSKGITEILDGAKPIAEGTWNEAQDKLTIFPEAINEMTTGRHVLTFKYGNNTQSYGNVTAYLWVVGNSVPTMSPAVATYSVGGSDVVFDVDMKDYTYDSVKIDDGTVNIDAGISYANGKLTFAASLLDTLSSAKHIITLKTKEGKDFNMSVIDTRKAPVAVKAEYLINPGVDDVVFLSVPVTLNGHKLGKLLVNSAEDSGVTSDGATIIISVDTLKKYRGTDFAVYGESDNGLRYKLVDITYKKTPTVMPESVSFNKADPEDLVFNVTSHGFGITGVFIDDTALTDVYTYEDDVLTIKKEAFSELALGTHELKLSDAEDSSYVVATITVVRETTGKVPDVGFDYLPWILGNDMEFKYAMDMGKYTFKSFKLDDEACDAITYDGADMRVQTAFLNTLSVGDHMITVVTNEGKEFDLCPISVKSSADPSTKVPTIKNKVAYYDGLRKDEVYFIVEADASTLLANGSTAAKLIDGKIIVDATYVDTLTDGVHEVTFKFDDVAKTEIVCKVVVTNRGEYAATVEPEEVVYVLEEGGAVELTCDKAITGAKLISVDGSNIIAPEVADLTNNTISEKFMKNLTAGVYLASFDVEGGRTNCITIKVKETVSEPDDDNHTISPREITYDKREKGDITFTLSSDIGVKSYVITDTKTTKTGHCTTPVIPENVLQNLDNGEYTVTFMCGDDIVSTSAKLTITRSGSSTGSGSDGFNWSYPGKNLPNRIHALGSGGHSDGPGGSSSGSTSLGGGSTSAGNSNAQYPTFDFNALTLLVSEYSGWEKQADGHWRFKDESGNYRTNTYLTRSSGSYVIDANGYMVTGWIMNKSGQWLYADSVNGNLTDGWQLVGGKWYYMAKQGDTTHTWGIMYSNETTPDGYRVDDSGAWIQ